MRMLIKFISSIFLVLVLTGCIGCPDCTNTKSEYDIAVADVKELREVAAKNNASLARLNAFWTAVEVKKRADEEKRRDSEQAVYVARMCDYIIPVCTSSKTAPGRALISEFGVKFDRPDISSQIAKVTFLACFPLLVIYLAVLSWLISIAPRKKIVDAAKLAVEAAEQALETANIEAKYIVEAAYKNAAAADLEASARLKVVKDATRQERATLEIAKNHLAEEETKLARVWLENAAQKKIQEDMKADRDALRGRF